MGLIAEQEINKDYALYNADCMSVLQELKSDSLHFSIYSPPFPELFQYSNDPRDMSNCTTYDETMRQFDFVIEQIYRLTMPGRLTAVHCTDLKRGAYMRDFPGDIVKLHEKHGFNFYCRITIWKDPWLVARRTRMRSLMHKTIVNDSSMSKVCGADYVIIFKKSGENTIPIIHPNGLKEYAGEEPIPDALQKGFEKYHGDQRKNLLSHWIWRQYAAPVWTDIRTGNLLEYEAARECEEEKHVCPLQLDVIERCVTLWSNPGEVVLTPFLGVGSEVYTAVKMGRRGIGIELKPTYYRQAVENVRTALDTRHQKELDFGGNEIENKTEAEPAPAPEVSPATDLGF